MTFIISITIINTNNTEMLQVITDLKDNYPNRNYVQGDSTTKQIQANLFDATYDEFVTTLTALINAYDDTEETGRLRWSFSFQEAVV